MTSISLDPAAASIAAGLTQQYTATGIYSDGSKRNLTATAIWTASPATPVSLGQATPGLATALVPAKTTISAAVNGMSGAATLTVTAATLTSIGVTPATIRLAAGVSQQFRATGVFTDDSTHDLTAQVKWRAVNPTVATPAAAAGAGLVDAVAVGSTTLTATLGAVAGSATLTVAPAALVSLGVTPATATLLAGVPRQFKATGVYTDESTHDLTTAVHWQSADAAVASVGAAAPSIGLATGVGSGTTTLNATLGAVSGTATVSVAAAQLVSLALTPSAATIAAGTTRQFRATATFSNGLTQDLTTAAVWTSAQATVAAVGNAAGVEGLATALGAGSTTLTAALGPVSAGAVLTVTPATLVSIAVAPASPAAASGTTDQFTATGTYSDRSTQDLTHAAAWSSSDATVASVSNAGGSQGLVSALRPGSVTIAAAAGGVAGAAALGITSAALQSIAISPPNRRIPAGSDLQFAATGTFTDGSTQPLTASVTWSSADGAVAALSNAADSAGLATAVGVGSTAVGAALAGIHATPVMLNVVLPEYAYVANGGDNSVSQYVIRADGTLSPLDPATVPTGTSPVWITVDPAAPYVFVVNSLDDTVSTFRIAAGGALTASNAGPTATGSGPVSAVVDPLGRALYVLNYDDGTVSQYAVGAQGALSPLTTPTVSTGAFPQAIAVDPTGSYAYVASATGLVSQYAVGGDGSLLALNPAAVSAGLYPQAIVADPNAPYVYVANNGDDTVSQFAIGAGGALTPLNPASVAAGSGPESLAVDPTGAYVFEADSAGTVSQFSIGGGGGLLPQVPASAAAADAPQAVAIDPSGQYAYVVNQGDDVVSQYALGTAGALTPIGLAAVPTGSGPLSIATAAR